jgi:hypothetical protein
MTSEVKMTIDERRKYLRIMQPRYQAATRQEQGELLAEMETVTGLHRKSLIRLLGGNLQRQARTRERSCVYDAEVEAALAVIVETVDYVCAERVHGSLLETVASLEQHGELQLTPTVRDKLAQISLSSLRRHAPGPADAPGHIAGPQRNGQTTWQQQLPAGRIPWDMATPGHLEIDLVHHSGPTASGEYVHTLQCIDICTGWSARRAILGRSYVVMRDALYHILEHLPFPVRELHPDNGSEFLNEHLLPFVREYDPTIQLSRSRPYQKNDNRFVEQKNRTLVRHFLGECRLDTVTQTRYLNHCYALMGQYYNFFQPVLHLVEKTWIPATATTPAHVRRIHDTAQPPLTRLCAAGILTHEEQTRWQAQRQAFNPRTLRTHIYQALEHLYRYPNAIPGNTENVFETLAYPERWPEARAALHYAEEKDSLEGRIDL